MGIRKVITFHQRGYENKFKLNEFKYYYKNVISSFSRIAAQEESKFSHPLLGYNK